MSILVVGFMPDPVDEVIVLVPDDFGDCDGEVVSIGVFTVDVPSVYTGV